MIKATKHADVNEHSRDKIEQNRKRINMYAEAIFRQYVSV